MKHSILRRRGQEAVRLYRSRARFNAFQARPGAAILDQAVSIERQLRVRWQGSGPSVEWQAFTGGFAMKVLHNLIIPHQFNSSTHGNHETRALLVDTYVLPGNLILC